MQPSTAPRNIKIFKSGVQQKCGRKSSHLKQTKITDIMDSMGNDFKTDIINMFKDLKKILSVLRRKIEYIKRINEIF